MTGFPRTRRPLRVVRSLGAFAATCVALTLLTGGCPPQDNSNTNGNDNSPTQPFPIPPGTQPGTGNQNTAPKLTFQWPTANVTIQDGTEVMIRFNGADTQDSMRVNVFADFINTTVTPAAATTIVLAQGRQLASPSTDDFIVWNTTNAIPATYTIRATITDQVNPAVTVSAPGQVTIVPRVPGSGPPVGPPVTPPNVSPTLRLVAPAASGVQLQQGELLTIIWETADNDDPVTVNVRADLEDLVDPQSIQLVTNLLVPVGTQRKQTVWNLTGVPAGTWNVTITAHETPTLVGQVPNPDPTPVSFPVRVVPAGSGTVNSPPTISVVLPSTDAGVTDGDILSLGFLVSDPNSDIDTLTIAFLLDRDTDPTNDAVQPPVEIGGTSLPAGTDFFGLPLPAGTQVASVQDVNIDGAQIPVRDDTDEGGRPLPYFIRIKVEDGRGAIVNAYASGKLRVLAPAEDMVDLLELGGRVSGSRWTGFHGEPFAEGRGARAGSSFAGIGDVQQNLRDWNGDGIADFAIVAQTATPMNLNNVGMVYLIYGRPRAVDPNLNFSQGRYSGVIDLNTVGSFVPFPANNPNFGTLWNIRGTQLTHPAVGQGGSSGISSVAFWPDNTGDGLPELLIGTAFADSVRDLKDNDPCDVCSDPPASFLCFDVGTLNPNAPESKTTNLLQVVGQAPANTWVPDDPANGPVQNVIVDIDDQQRLLTLTGPNAGLDLCLKFNGVVNPTLFAVSAANNRIREVDFNTGATVRSAPIVVAGQPAVTGAFGLAANPDTRELFALVSVTAGQADRLLVKVDPISGAAALLGNTGLPTASGLTFGADGATTNANALFCIADNTAGAAATLFRLNQINGAAVAIGPFGAPGLGVPGAPDGDVIAYSLGADNGNADDDRIFRITGNDPGETGQILDASQNPIVIPPIPPTVPPTPNPAPVVLALSGFNFNRATALTYDRTEGADGFFLADTQRNFCTMSPAGNVQFRFQTPAADGVISGMAFTIPRCAQITILAQLEPQVIRDPDEAPPVRIKGPCLSKTVTVKVDDDGAFDYDCAQPLQEQPECPVVPLFVPEDAIRFAPVQTGFLSEFPVALDPVGNMGPPACQNLTAGTRVSMPPSVYDGVFSVFLQFNRDVIVQQSSVKATGFYLTETPNEFAHSYGDGFPELISNGTCTTAVVNPIAASSLSIACPPANDNTVSSNFLTGYLCTDLGIGRIGTAPPPPQGLFTIPAGPEQDNMYVSTPPDEPYQSGLLFVAASDQLQLPQFGLGAGGTPNRVVDIGNLGQGGQRGGRVRGSWFQTDNPNTYDSTNRFGQTVDTMPDMNASLPPTEEVLVSAPGSGRCGTANQDLSADLAGSYLAAANTIRTARWDFINGGQLAQCDGGVWNKHNRFFSNATGGGLFVHGFAQRCGRLVAFLLNDDPNIPPILIGDKVFFPGAGTELNQYVNGRVEFNFTFAFPAGALDLPPFDGRSFDNRHMAFPTVSQDWGWSIGLLAVQDCAVTPSDVDTPVANPVPPCDGISPNEPAFCIDTVQLAVAGLAPDIGAVFIVDGIDLTTNDSAPHTGDRDITPFFPVSWPGFNCVQGARVQVSPPLMTSLWGNVPGDEFGFAKYAGDLNLDGQPDFACGSPGASTDPTNAGGVPLENNGQSFVIYGTPVLGVGPVGPPFERFEIRGSHGDDLATTTENEGDQFGRNQGNVGDFSGDSNEDVFFSSDRYDFTGPVTPTDNMPALNPGETRRKDCGFVGIMFGNPTLTGETTRRAEEIGTGNFFGCKFIGGSAGARLGEAVANAGDFNQDGKGDILITAPGQDWPAVSMAFKGNVANGQQIVVNGVIFEFDTDVVASVAAGAIRVDVRNDPSASGAQREFIKQFRTVSRELTKVSAIASRLQFPDPLPDDPTVTFLPRQPVAPVITTTVPAGSLTVKTTVRQGVAYLIFGGNTPTLNLTNKVFTLPQDLNRRSGPDVTSPRILKGMVFVSAFEKDEPGDVDGDGQPGFFVDFETGGIGITNPNVTQLATISGGSQQVPPQPPPPAAQRALVASGTQGYVVTNGTPATISFSQRPACEITAYFVFDQASGATGATMTAFNLQGQVISVVQATAAPGLPLPGAPPRPGAPPAAVTPPWVRILQPGAIASITITVQGAPGARAVVDDLWLQDPTPDGAPIEAVAGIGDVDADGLPDIMLGAPTADNINILEPCNRRKSAGEAYLIHGNAFGFNNPSQP